MKRYLNLGIKFSGLVFMGLAGFWSADAKRPLRRAEPAVKEYVVVSAGKDSVAERLGVLYDKLKLFSNYPKKLKDLQAETDKLEDSLRQNIAKMKDAHYVISRVRTETATMRNDIPTQEDNAKAKEVFDKVVEYWNSAEGEIEKIAELGHDFDKVSSQINSKVDEIGKVLEDGGQEIKNIKDELDKIAAMEEELAGADERGIAKQIAGFTDKMDSPQVPRTERKSYKPVASSGESEVKSLVFSEHGGRKSVRQETSASPAVLTVTESLSVVWRLFVRFVTVAFNGAKDLFVRLFVVDTATDESKAKKESSGSNLQGAEQYKQAAIKSLVGLKDSIVGIAQNSYSYVKELYAKSSGGNSVENKGSAPAKEKKLNSKKPESSMKDESAQKLDKKAKTDEKAGAAKKSKGAKFSVNQR